MLALDASSELSRLNPFAVAAGTIYAIADSDSTNSIRDKCVVTVIQPTTRFWSRTTSGVTLLTGEESGVSFVATAPGRYWVNESASTAVVVVTEGTDRIDQSVQSKVVVQFKFADSELDLS
jgi:hypothetical protein